MIQMFVTHGPILRGCTTWFIPRVKKFLSELKPKLRRKRTRNLTLAGDYSDPSFVNLIEDLDQLLNVQVFRQAFPIRFDHDGKIGEAPHGLEQILGTQSLEPKRRSS